MSPLTRRQLLLASAAGAAVAATGQATAVRPRAQRLPRPAASGIEHIVVVLMENRSFDHYLGWLPGADGRQAGLSYADDKGVEHPTHHLTDRQGCGFNDPDHSYTGGQTQLNAGKCDGFRKGANDDYALGYYTRADLPFYGPLTGQSTVFDRWFCSILSSTYPNRYYTHSGRTERLDNAMVTTSMPTIWDRLAGAGVSANYYFSDLPFLALYGEKYLPISRHMEDFFAQAASGTLPAYSYLDPFFLGEDQGGSNDDHPHADIWRGQAFVSLVAQAVVNSPLWSKTALVITYDEWGGFFDHVPPPVGPDPNPDLGAGLRGFRVPCLVVSPRARRGYVAHGLYDHTSVLKLIEWRFGLAPLTVRDAAANNLAEVLDFGAPPVLDAPRYHVPQPITFGCLLPLHAHSGEDWPELAAAARSRGFAAKG